MTHRDANMDAMLRHLGAAYYESMHGRASAADVARARAVIEEGMAERPATAARPGDGKKQGRTPPTEAHHHGRWHSTVRDVMATDVVTVDRITQYKEIAQLLAEHKISAVPVLTMGRHVAGWCPRPTCSPHRTRLHAGPGPGEPAFCRGRAARPRSIRS